MDRAPFSLVAPWEHVAQLYAWIVSLFGSAEEIAAQRMLMRQTRRDLLAWLGPVEALARRLLLLKALTLTPPNQPPAPQANGRLLIAFTDAPEWTPEDNAERWRVVFRILPRGALGRRLPAGAPAGCQRSEDPRATNFNAFALARRIEALRRVLENPKPAVARLARALAAQRGDVKRAFRPYRPPATCAAEALAEAQQALALAFDTS